MNTRLPPFTAERLLHILKSQLRAHSYLVGFSGGADSSALLHALWRLQDELAHPIAAVHVNHGLHTDADLWQQHCEKFCQDREITLTCLRIELENRSGKGLEAEARQLRYQAMSALLKTGDSLLTAHHADDQAETLLLNLMRGSGVDGLAAMPASRPLAAGVLQRPLLNFENSELIKYLHRHDVSWIEDPSNQLLTHDRNFVRHQLMPLLESRWQGTGQRLLLTRNAMAESRSLLERLADEYLANNLCHPLIMRVSSQLDGDPALFKLAMRRWLKRAAVPPIPARSLQSLYQQVFQSGKGRNTRIEWAGWLLRFYQKQLWLQRINPRPPGDDFTWPGDSATVELGDGRGRLLLVGKNTQKPPPGLLISSRKNCQGQAIRQGAVNKSLKNIFQAAGIPGWLRDSIPICQLEGVLVAIGDWCFDDNFAAWLSENQLTLSWQPAAPLLKYIVAQQHPVDHSDAVR